MTKLKDIIESLNKLIEVSNKEMDALETRIFMGENLIKSINQMNDDHWLEISITFELSTINAWPRSTASKSR